MDWTCNEGNRMYQKWCQVTGKKDQHFDTYQKQTCEKCFLVDDWSDDENPKNRTRHDSDPWKAEAQELSAEAVHGAAALVVSSSAALAHPFPADHDWQAGNHGRAAALLEAALLASIHLDTQILDTSAVWIP